MSHLKVSRFFYGKNLVYAIMTISNAQHEISVCEVTLYFSTPFLQISFVSN